MAERGASGVLQGELYLPSRRGTVRRFRQLLSVVPLGSLVILLIFGFCAVLAPWISPHDPTEQNLIGAVQPPAWDAEGSSEHLLGTDLLGRDVLSRIIHGTRLTAQLSIAAVAISFAFGTLLGLVAGYSGRWTETVIMRFVDFMLAMPNILIGLIFAATFGGGFMTILVILVITGWVQYTRVVRGQVLSLREREYVELARVAGMSGPMIMWKHLLPNLSGTLIVLATLNAASVILFEAALSFLGIGMQPPSASWGLMLSDGREALSVAPWLATYPGLAIMFTVLSLNLMGDRLRDHFDPHLRQVS